VDAASVCVPIELRVLGFEALADAIGMTKRQRNAFLKPMFHGEDKDFSPATWEKSMAALSSDGFIDKLADYCNVTIALKAAKKLEELGKPWVDLEQ
jgi:hypothetical protein